MAFAHLHPREKSYFSNLDRMPSNFLKPKLIVLCPEVSELWLFRVLKLPLDHTLGRKLLSLHFLPHSNVMPQPHQHSVSMSRRGVAKVDHDFTSHHHLPGVPGNLKLTSVHEQALRLNTSKSLWEVLQTEGAREQKGDKVSFDRGFLSLFLSCGSVLGFELRIHTC